MKRSRLNRERTILWNIVRWALRKDNRNHPPKPEDIREGKVWLEKLLGKLEALEVVLLCGIRAYKATGFFYTRHDHLHVLHAPHPSPQSMNQPGKEEHLEAAHKEGRAPDRRSRLALREQSFDRAHGQKHSSPAVRGG